MDIAWLEQNELNVPIGNQWLSVQERICLDGMRFAKRRTDWRLGRWTAKHAVAACLDLPTDIPGLTDIEVLAAPSGAPQVLLQNRPANVAVSLSHREGTALCAVAPAGTSFGCDLETIESHSNAFIADYCTGQEQDLIARAPAECRDLLVGLIWSAKESALKALHLGLRMDTRCVCVRPTNWLLETDGKRWRELCAERLSANPDGWQPLSVHCSSGPIYSGWWRFQDHLVRTMVCDCRLQMPKWVQQNGLAETHFFP